MARKREGEVMGGGGEGGKDGGKLLRRYLGDPRLFVAPPPQRQLLEGNKEASLGSFYTFHYNLNSHAGKYLNANQLS